MNKKALITIILFFALSLCLFIFCIWPYSKEIKLLSADLVAEKDQINLLSSKIADVSSFKREYENYLPNLQKIEQMFVDRENPLEFIEFVETVAESSGILLQVSPQSSAQGKKASFQLSLRGALPSLIKFLGSIERGSYLLAVKNLNASSHKGEIGIAGIPTEGNLSEEVQANILVEVLLK